MPIYEYDCRRCEQPVEILVRNEKEQPICPRCGQSELKKLLSVIAAPLVQGRGDVCRSEDAPTCGRPACAGGGCMMG